MSNNPGQTCGFEILIKKACRLGRVPLLAGLPPHLQVVNDQGEPQNSLRRQFCKGKASKKKRGK